MTTTPTRPIARTPLGPGASGWLRFAAVSSAAITSVAVLAAVDPNQPGHYPTCPSLALTGLYCPGCGSLRAIHALTQGDVVTAWQRNPLALAALPLLLAAWLAWAWRLSGRPIWGRSAPHPTQIPPRVIWFAFGLVLAFWVLRNVPGWTWLSPL